jgi:catechol 2,3-dioxygenase-like lactoylglutathione lyase family enzyme
MTDYPNDIIAAAKSVRALVPMLFVADVRATVHWYQSIGFTLEDHFEDDGQLVFAKLSLGKAAFALAPIDEVPGRVVNLWFFTDAVDELYTRLRASHAFFSTSSGAGPVQEKPMHFREELHEPFYGGRQFTIEDNNGLELVFWQPRWLIQPT